MIIKRVKTLTCLLAGCLILCSFSQAQDDNWNRKIQELSILSQGPSEYKLGPGDLIEVSVYGVDNFTHLLRVSSDGEISVPYVGAVKAAGLSTVELEGSLRTVLEGRLIRNPQVAVFVKEYKSQPVFVLGAVNNPGQYQITQPLRLVDVIAMAGGIDLTRAGDKATIQRRPADFKITAGDAQNGLIDVDLKALLEGGALPLNIPVQGGDVINIPERVVKLFYILGEVHHPGVFELPADEELFLTQALAWAGGPMKTAKLGKGVLVRYSDSGERQQMAMDIGDMINGKKADVVVSANDVIFVPGSTIKNIGYGLLGTIPRTVSGAILNGPTRRP